MIDDGFAKVLRTLRRERGLSQDALADATDLSRPYISQLERALKSPSLRILARLAAALDVSVSEMMILVEREMGVSPGKASERTAAHSGRGRATGRR